MPTALCRTSSAGTPVSSRLSSSATTANFSAAIHVSKTSSKSSRLRSVPKAAQGLAHDCRQTTPEAFFDDSAHSFKGRRTKQRRPSHSPRRSAAFIAGQASHPMSATSASYTRSAASAAAAMSARSAAVGSNAAPPSVSARRPSATQREMAASTSPASCDACRALSHFGGCRWPLARRYSASLPPAANMLQSAASTAAACVVRAATTAWSTWSNMESRLEEAATGVAAAAASAAASKSSLLWIDGRSERSRAGRSTKGAMVCTGGSISPCSSAFCSQASFRQTT
mmetsp:Transcript_17706/g.59710  ORF Transcript_17706/g.59710 Transcript_17706/m.59710 type:complete len:284 (+) Transcript_17706:1077-1928(+)